MRLDNGVQMRGVMKLLAVEWSTIALIRDG